MGEQAKVVVALAGLAGAALLCLLLGFLKSRRCSATATAVIVGVDEERDRDSDGSVSRSYTPVYRFVTARGEVITGRGGASSGSHRKWRVGASQRVRYNPGRPQEFLDRGGNFWTSLGLCLLLLVALAGGLYVWSGQLRLPWLG